MNAQSLLLATIQQDDVEHAARGLTDAELRATLISSMGGFLRIGNVTLLLGLAQHEVQKAISVLAANCQQRTIMINAASDLTTSFVAPIEAEVGGANIFVLPVEYFVRFGVQTEVAISEAQAKTEARMKLIVAIIAAGYADAILKMLIEAQYRATLISSTGGFFRKGNVTLLIGVEPERVADVLKRIEAACQKLSQPADSKVASATIFVLNAEQYLRV